MLEQRTAIDEDGRVIYLDRTYVVDRATQTPILRSNVIAINPETGNRWQPGESIKLVDFEQLQDSKPRIFGEGESRRIIETQFIGWVGSKKIIETRLDPKPSDGSIRDGLVTFTIFV